MAAVLIIAAIPIDIDALAAALGMSTTLEITEGYTQTTCDECGKSCWIGERQRETYETRLGPVAILCYVCIMARPQQSFIMSLGNPNAAKEKPL